MHDDGGRVEQPGKRNVKSEQNIPPGKRKALLSDLATAEGLIRNDSDRDTVVVFKDGKGVFVRQALGTSVDLADAIRKNPDDFEGSVLTHNHPQAAAFSYYDVETASLARLKEIRAVSHIYQYSLIDRQGNMDPDYFTGTVNPIWSQEFADWLQEMNPTRRLLSAEEMIEFTHRLLESVARRTRLVYTRNEISRRQQNHEQKENAD